MIREGRQWVEVWNEYMNGWCYYNGKTGEMLLFNPPITGYTRVADADADGPVLVLQSGRNISSEEERNKDLQA